MLRSFVMMVLVIGCNCIIFSCRCGLRKRYDQSYFKYGMVEISNGMRITRVAFFHSKWFFRLSYMAKYSKDVFFEKVCRSEDDGSWATKRLKYSFKENKCFIDGILGNEEKIPYMEDIIVYREWGWTSKVLLSVILLVVSCLVSMGYLVWK